ncbi:uncharacterized protein LOC123308208 [Coccinella septempunctata]|uniref:uncharacterized protein LOC123308208 n=1 Tax=Coccinella septempunctata TaxID=41139 RepID=UPI001D0778EB|nr:uncharacterized protein LOC123308208 [Coccinella septempunctata]
MKMTKTCFVPKCLNSSKSAPNKCFIFVPRNPTKRKAWFDAVGATVVKAVRYCCEDHFNLKEDSIDFSLYKRTKMTPRIRKGIVPYLFITKPNRNIFSSQLDDSEENTEMSSVGASQEKYPDKHIQYDHTASREDEKKCHVELGNVNICEQFIDEEGVHGREEYIIKNEESTSNSSYIEMDVNQSPATFEEEMPLVLDPTSIKSEPVDWEQEKYLDHTANFEDDKKWHVELGNVDICEQFKDEIVVQDTEEYKIKKEESMSNSSVIEVDANHSPATFKEEMPPVLDPTSIKSEPFDCEQCEFPKCHLAGVSEDGNLDKPIQYDHTNHTYSLKDDEKCHVKSELVDIFEQFRDKEVNNRGDYTIKNEETNPNFLVIEDNSNQSPASFNEEMPPVLATGIKSDMFNLGVVDTCEQFIDEEGVHDREEYIIENEKINPNSLIREGDANQSPAFFTKETPQIFDLENDEAIPVTINNQECYMCDFETKDEKDLALHIKSVHSSIKCHLCEYVTSRKRDFLMHVERVHLDRKKQECNISGCAAHLETTLDLHMKSVHLKTKEYKCHLCEYAGSAKRDLERHIKSVHLKIKEHRCNLCEYITSRKENLRRHFDTVHLDIKKHKCHLCDYAATDKSIIQRHVESVHLNINKCHLCEFATSAKQTLDSHVKSVHLKIKEHRCHLCEYAASRRGVLKKHFDSIHLNIKRS